MCCADWVFFFQPDIVVEPRHQDDEFIVIACDGVWDCMSNDEVGAFVRQRIDSVPLSRIISEIFDSIITRDPKVSQGIGADNMTCIIVRLNGGKMERASGKVGGSGVSADAAAVATDVDLDVA